MALQESEGTKKEVLEKIRIPGGAKNAYTMIFQAVIDFANKNYTASILSFASKEARDEDITSGHPYFIGGPLTEEQMDEMKNKDVRNVLYPDIEKLIPEHAGDGKIG